jgi:O-antigen ligase
LIQVNALDQFLNSPWLGSAYIELSTGFIPHNMLLESAMALGTFGAILFLILSFRGLRHGFEQSKSGSLFIPMIYIQSLINSQLSGSLWQSADFWACIILLSSSASIRKNVLIGNRMKARVV